PDYAGLLQQAHPSRAWRGRKPHLLRNLRGRELCVALQHPQYLPVDYVELRIWHVLALKLRFLAHPANACAADAQLWPLSPLVLPYASGADGETAMPDLTMLSALERKVLWLATWMIHNANHLRDNG